MTDWTISGKVTERTRELKLYQTIIKPTLDDNEVMFTLGARFATDSGKVLPNSELHTCLKLGLIRRLEQYVSVEHDRAIHAANQLLKGPTTFRDDFLVALRRWASWGDKRLIALINCDLERTFESEKKRIRQLFQFIGSHPQLFSPDYLLYTNFLGICPRAGRVENPEEIIAIFNSWIKEYDCNLDLINYCEYRKQSHAGGNGAMTPYIFTGATHMSSEAANKAWVTRRANAKKRSDAANKAVATRRKNAKKKG